MYIEKNYNGPHEELTTARTYSWSSNVNKCFSCGVNKSSQHNKIYEIKSRCCDYYRRNKYE